MSLIADHYYKYNKFKVWRELAECDTEMWTERMLLDQWR